MVSTTITVDSTIRDRLKGFRVGTYDDTLTFLMDQVEKAAFVDEFRRAVDDPSHGWQTIDWNDPVWD